MRPLTFFSALCAASFLLAGADPALAAETLTGEQITALLSGKTVEGSAGATTLFSKHYTADGTYTITFKDDGATMEGTWQVKGDQYCQTRKKRTEEDCYTVEKNDAGNGYTMHQDGVVHTTFEVK